MIERRFRVFDSGNSLLKACFGRIIPNQVAEEVAVEFFSDKLDFTKYKQTREISTSHNSYEFTALTNPEFFLQEFLHLAHNCTFSEVADNHDQDQEFLGLTGFNNWLVLIASIQKGEGTSFEETVVIGENPSLTIPLDDQVCQQLRLIYETGGVTDAQEKVISIQKKNHYLLHSLSAVTQDQELLRQLFQLDSLEQIIQLKYGDFQGWLMNNLKPQIEFGFTPQNLRSLGAQDPDQAKEILQTCFDIELPVVHSWLSLNSEGVCSENDLSAEIQMLESLFDTETAIYLSFDSVLKILALGFTDSRLPNKLSKTSYLVQRTGGAIGNALQPFLESFTRVDNIFELMSQKILTMFQDEAGIPSEFLFYPVEDDFGRFYKNDGTTWQEIDISSLNGQTDPRLIMEIREDIGQDIDGFIRAIILGMVFASRQKAEALIKASEPQTQATIVLGGGLVGYNRTWEVLSEIIFSNIPKVNTQKLEGFQGAHQALLWCIMQAIANGEFNQLDAKDEADTLLMNSIAQNLDRFLPKVLEAKRTIQTEDGEMITPSQDFIDAMLRYYQFWLQQQAQKVYIGQYAQLYGSNE